MAKGNRANAAAQGVVRVFPQAGDILLWRVEHHVDFTGFKRNQGNAVLWNDAEDHFVQIGGKPLIFIALERDVIVRDVFDELERTRTNGRVVVGIAKLLNSFTSINDGCRKTTPAGEQQRVGLAEGQFDGVIVERLDGLEGRFQVREGSRTAIFVMQAR